MSSAPHTPTCSPKNFIKSPVGKLNQYFLPDKRDQYQKFSYDKDFLLPVGDFDWDQFLDVPPPPPAIICSVQGIDMESFVKKANEVAKCIKGQRKHHLFLYLAFLVDI